MSKILVTGASGLIGSHLVADLKSDHEVVSLVHHQPRGRWLREALDGTTVIQADIRDFSSIKRIMARFEVTHVAHMAALAKVRSAYHDPLSVYGVNIMGAVAVLEAARQLEIERVLVMQTDKVYGEKLGATVEDPYQPSEPYATSKICQGFIAWSYIDTYGMDVMIPHSCNVFGFDPFSNRIFPNTIRACLRGEQPLIFTNDGSIREYIFVDDLVDALKVLLLKPEMKPGPYNIATGWVHNQRRIVQEVLKHFKLTAKWVKGKLPRQIQEQTMAQTRWNWKPGWSFDDAVERTVALFERYRGDWE